MLKTLYLLPAMAVPDLVLLKVLKDRYVKLAPINRSTLTEFSNYMCKLPPPSNFSTPESFKNFIMRLLRNSCTWTLIRSCPSS